jgi:hypothetical protein
VETSGKRLQIDTRNPTDPREAAAIVASIERFIGDTTRRPEIAATANRWQQAALREGVNARGTFGHPGVGKFPSWR